MSGSIYLDSDRVFMPILAMACGNNVEVHWQRPHLVLLHHREPHVLKPAVNFLLHLQCEVIRVYMAWHMSM